MKAQPVATGKRTNSPPPVESLDVVQRARRDSIVGAAIEMMLELEYDRIQMKDITAAAGVALGTTYRYFASKDHLMGEALLAWSEGFPAGSPDAKGRSIDHLKLAYRRAVRAFEPHPTAYGALVVLQSSNDPYVTPLFERFSARQAGAFAQYLPKIAPERRLKIISVMSAVLSESLRDWAFGRSPIGRVYQKIDDAADLILGS